MQYTDTSIYGYYVRQESLINGRPWYKNNVQSIWWDDTDKGSCSINHCWRLGVTTKIAGSFSNAKLDNIGRCLPKIPNQKWKLWNGYNWNDAGNKVKVRCGNKPKGKYKFLHNQM